MGDVHHLQGKLKSLKLGGMLDSLDLRLGQAQQSHLGYVEFLELLLEDELQRRANKRLVNRVTRARFEEVKTFESFDFTFNAKIPVQQIKDLATCQFIERQEWAIFVGPVGVGKTHLAIGLGMEAIRVGYSVYFISLSELADQVPPDRTDPRWTEKLRVLSSHRLLIIDEVGYVPLDRMVSHFIFSLVCRRYEKGSMIWTSNWGFAEWASVFGGDEVLTAAILDRLLHHGTVVNIRGQSYQLKEKLRGGILEGREPAQTRTSRRQKQTSDQA